MSAFAGMICLLGDCFLFPLLASTQIATPHHPEKLIQSLKEDPHRGEKIYNAFCSVCHNPDPQIPVGAPIKGVSADWANRHKTVDQMMKSVSDGMNNMPARGGCFECSDELLKAAIEHLVQ